MKKSKTELIRLYNVDAQSDKGHDLESFSLSVMAGEILGIYGSRYVGKHALIRVLSGDRRIRRGYLFVHGEPTDWAHYQVYAGGHVVSVASQPRLIVGLSVWENVSAFLGIRDRRKFFKASVQRAMAAVLLREYGLDFAVDMPVRDLNSLQRLILEMVIFRTRKTELILVDLNLTEGSIYDHYLLGSLLSRFAGEGVTTILCGQQMDLIRQYADRIAILYKGQNIRTVRRSPGFDQELEYIAGILRKDDAAGVRNTDPGAEEKMAEIRCILQTSLTGFREDLSLRSGSFTVVKVLDQAVTDRCQRVLEAGNHRSDVLFCDMEQIDRVIPELTPAENLCMGILDRTSGSPYIRKRLVDYVIREFCEWYEHGSEMMGAGNCHQLFHRDRTAINLFRIRLMHVKTLICTDYTIFNDAVSEQLIRRSFDEYLREGMAICLLTQNMAFHDEMADRILFAGNTGSVT